MHRICAYFCLAVFVYRHPTSCASAAEIMSVLFFNVMKYSTSFPRDPASDRFVMSKVSYLEFWDDWSLFLTYFMAQQICIFCSSPLTSQLRLLWNI